MMTSRTLTLMGVHHFVVAEPDQVPAYEKAASDMRLLATILPLDMEYKARYETCDNLGLTMSTGSGPARNFIWDHAVAAGHAWHWIMDDNIRNFWRMNRNEKVQVTTGAIFRAMEDFCLRYRNVAMAGPNYESFAVRRSKRPPFTLNTRIYSCNFIRNDVPFRWRGRFNEDTILSLDMLKAGWCTILFNAFLQKKLKTQLLPGGNTDELYRGQGRTEASPYAINGTLEKSRMLARVHSDVARLVWKFDRWHHHVNYDGFKRRRLLLADGVRVPATGNEYGMRIVEHQSPRRSSRRPASSAP